MRSHRRRHMFTVLLTAVILFAATVTPAASAPSAQAVPPRIDASIARAGSYNRASPADAPYEFTELQTKVTVWADDRGEVIMQQKIRNISSEPITDFSWGFGFGDTSYEPILAWDAFGVLTHHVTHGDGGITITADFRQPLFPNNEYQFALTVSIAGMTETTANDGNAHWSVSPGAQVRSFVHGVTLPLSANIRTIVPEPTSRVQSYIEWRRSNSGNSIDVDITYGLRNDIPNVPLFLQGDPAWGGDTWYTYDPDTPGETIRKWGCNLTSAAMLINYYAAANGATGRTTPGQFNTWIRSKGITSVSAIYAAAMSYAKELGVPFHMPDNPILAQGAGSDQRLRTYMRTGNPVILRVNAASASGIHFVVATGITTYNGQSTYTIHDPVYGQTTLAQRYPAGYTQVNLFNSTSPDRRTLMSIIHSPAELVLTDPQGRRTGYDPTTGVAYAEIPGAVYVSDTIAPADDTGIQTAMDEKYVFVPSPIDGEYTVQVIGTASGEYLVEHVATDWTGNISAASVTGVTSEGQIDEEPVDYDGTIGVVLGRIYLPTVQR